MEGASPPEGSLPAWNDCCRCPFEYPAGLCKATRFRSMSCTPSAAPRGLVPKIPCSISTSAVVLEGVSTSVDIGRRTNATLINRVKDLDDDDGWREFYDRYRGLVLNTGHQRGLTTAESEEVGQEVFLRIARNIGLIATGGEPGTFRRWLGQLTMWCTIDAQRRRCLQTSPIETESGRSGIRTVSAHRLHWPVTPSRM